MDGTEEMGGEDSSGGPIFCLLPLWIHFILSMTKKEKKKVTSSYCTRT